MIENYIDQIITMEVLADNITIMDDKGIICYYRNLRGDMAAFNLEEVVGKHFMEVFPSIRPEESTVFKALKGEPTFEKLVRDTNFKGQVIPYFECVYPIMMEENIVGAACITRNAEKHIDRIDIKIKDEMPYSLDDIIGDSIQMQRLKMQIIQLAETDVNIMIQGETGTGKELVARAIHNSSKRKNEEMYAQNCAAIPSALLESIFFGTEKGIYTGAVSRAGVLEKCNGGVVFLDEINTLDLSIQAKLLRAIEEKEVMRLGSDKLVSADFRVLSATNEDPFSCINSGRMRRDFFYRLGTIVLEVPPLRERKEDIVQLVNYFIKKSNRANRHYVAGVTKEVEEIFLNYSWPGNVRELKNAIDSAMVFAKSPLIEKENLPAYITGETTIKREATVELEGNSSSSHIGESTLKEAMETFEREFLTEKLLEHSNHTELSRRLNVTRQTLINKLNKYGIC